MRRNAVYGVGVGINGREAVMQATQNALDQLGTSRPVLALVFVSQEFSTAEVLNGLTGLLGDTPLWGFSTVRPLTSGGDQPRSVVVALLTGNNNRAAVHWYPDYAGDSSGFARQFIQNLRQEVFFPQQILLAADGINGSLIPLMNSLADLPVKIAGCMASGDPLLGKTFQLGGNQAGPGGLSAAFLSGHFQVGVGVAQGWHDLGIYYRVTRARDVWLQALDGISTAEVFARMFGYTAREWAFPPLTEMTRLYPFGVEIPKEGDVAPSGGKNSSELLIRSALRVEVDGSLRMSAPVPLGSVVHLMTGEPDACLKAARQAVRNALDDLGKNVRPLLAVALVDTAWQLLFESRPSALSEALSSELKIIHPDLPLVGAYTFGQLVRPAPDQLPILHNQNLELLIIGEVQE